MIAALFVESGGVYFDCEGVDPWDRRRDARTYQGPWAIVAHPPCERWGRYWFGGPSAKVRRKLGDDSGCFRATIDLVERFGGVIEHPESSRAWEAFGIASPRKNGGWVSTRRGFSCCVDQGHYGHPAAKATWLYVVGVRRENLPTLIWGRATGKRRIDLGCHTREERLKRRASGRLPRRVRLTRRERVDTPIAFRDLLITIAESVDEIELARSRSLDEKMIGRREQMRLAFVDGEGDRQ